MSRAEKINRKSVFQDILGAVARQEAEGEDNVRLLSLDALRLPERQPRRYFAPRAMDALIGSIQRHGILQPLLVRPVAEDQAGSTRSLPASAAIGLLARQASTRSR